MLELAPYVALTVALVAGGVFSPLPEEATLVAAGAAIAAGAMSLWVVIAVAVLAVVAGDLVIVAMGRASAIACAGIVREAPARRHARTLVGRWGVSSVVAARFVPGLRGAVFFVSGAAGFRPLSVAAIDVAAALVHVPLLLAVGGGLVRC